MISSNAWQKGVLKQYSITQAPDHEDLSLIAHKFFICHNEITEISGNRYDGETILSKHEKSLCFQYLNFKPMSNFCLKSKMAS